MFSCSWRKMDYRQIVIYVLLLTYFFFARCLLPHPVSAKDPGHEGVSLNGSTMISSSAAFLFCNLFEYCYLRTLDSGQKCLKPQEKQQFQDVKRHIFIFLCIIEVFFGEKRHSYEISYTFGAEICNSSVETSYKWWLQNKCPLVWCLQSIWLPHCTGCLCCHCASVAAKVHSGFSHGEHLQSIVEGLLASGVFPSVLMLSMGPISPSCHNSWLTIIIGKGSIQSSYKLQRTTSIVFGTSMLAGQGGYTMLVYLLIQSYLKRPKWVLCCHPPPG